ncbi:MAG: isocitrate/isopropylmalate dehydrogenase family protein [Rhodospirillaceae bacterium]
MKFVIIENDGIGHEIMAATVPVLERLNQAMGLGIEYQHCIGGLKGWQEKGMTVPEETRVACDAADGVIVGPVGTYEYPPEAKDQINPNKYMRTHFDLFANVRPAKTRAGVPSVIKQMDLVIVRENREGFYADRNMYMGSGEFMPTEDCALSVRKITRQGSERIARYAFDMAKDRRKKVTMVHKANVLKLTDGLFRDTVTAVSKDYPGIELEELIIDAATAHVVRRPQDFDVIVTTNAFGDILSDLCSELSGSLGLAGSINVGPKQIMAQAQHGSAPDIAGQGKANPTALILSVGMLLEELGRRTSRNDLAQAAGKIYAAVDTALAEPKNHTGDLGGKNTTSGFGGAVTDALDLD